MILNDTAIMRGTELGHGGYGTVYSGRLASNGLQVAYVLPGDGDLFISYLFRELESRTWLSRALNEFCRVIRK